MVLYIALLAVFTTAALMRLYWDGKCTPFNAPASWLVLRHCAALGAPESTMPSFRLLRYLLLLGWLSFQVHNPKCRIRVSSNHFCDFFSFMETKIRFPLSLLWQHPTLTCISNFWEGTRHTRTRYIRNNRWESASLMLSCFASSIRKVECLPYDQLDLTLASGAKIKLKKSINTHLPGTFWRFLLIMLI